MKYWFFVLIFIIACTNPPVDNNKAAETTTKVVDSAALSHNKEAAAADDEETKELQLPNPNGTIADDIAFMSAYNYWENPDFDMDEFGQKVAKRVVKKLLTETISEKQAEKMGMELAVDSKYHNIKIYNFSFHCGGTRGDISHPIIQWQNSAGKLFAYNLSSVINCGFYSIKKLAAKDKNLYLLLADERGSGACVQNIAYCIEIRNDYLILNNPVFLDRSCIGFCNMDLEFDEKKQVLTGKENEDFGDGHLLIETGNYTNNEQTEAALKDLVSGLYTEKKRFTLRFDGEQFVK